MSPVHLWINFFLERPLYEEGQLSALQASFTVTCRLGAHASPLPVMRILTG